MSSGGLDHSFSRLAWKIVKEHSKLSLLMFFRYSVGCFIVVVVKSSEDRSSLTRLGINPLEQTSNGMI